MIIMEAVENYVFTRNFLQSQLFDSLHGDTSYYTKLKELYQSQNIWEQKRESLLQELSKALTPHEYALLLAKEGEVQRLLEVVMQHNSYVMYRGKHLAESFPEETY